MKETGKLLYAASESCADLRYITGFSAPDPFIWLDLGREQVVVVSPLEYGRACRQLKDGITLLTIAQAAERADLRDIQAKPDLLIAALLKKAAISTLLVPGNFPLAIAERLREHGIKLKHQSPFFPERRRKTEDEICEIRKGVRLAEHGFYRAVKILRKAVIGKHDYLFWKGKRLTAEHLRTEIVVEILKRGGNAQHTIVAPGRQGADPHEAGYGPIRAHQPIVMDIFPQVERSGYYGDFTRTVLKGQADSRIREIHRAVVMAQQAAIATVRPGVSAATVHRAAEAVFENAGLISEPTAKPPRGFIHSTGHGLGLDIHEQPRVAAVPDRLRAGDVITIEPGYYDQRWGGIRLEDVVVVEKGGCRNLTQAHRLLRIS